MWLLEAFGAAVHLLDAALRCTPGALLLPPALVPSPLSLDQLRKQDEDEESWLTDTISTPQPDASARTPTSLPEPRRSALVRQPPSLPFPSSLTPSPVWTAVWSLDAG